MNDQTAWKQAVVTTSEWYFGLPSGIRTELDGLLEEIMQLKQKLVDLVMFAGSSNICRACGGECCRYGKYHVSVLDIMTYLKTGAEQVTPDFSTTPACPYSDVSGCTMAPSYRPMTCVVFNCQQIEDHLAAAEHKILHGYEQELRDAILKAGHITGMRLDRALLLCCS